MGSSSSMICIARTFGAPTSVPAGNVGAEQIERILARIELAMHAAHDVHHVAVFLDAAIRLHVHAARGGHTTQVVAREIDEHHVLRILFRIGEQSRLTLGVDLLVRRARQRAGDGAQLRMSLIELHERFGRRADDRHVAERTVVHVRRRIDEAERAIDLERMQVVLAAELDGEHELINIAGGDVFLHALHAGHVLGGAHARHRPRVLAGMPAVRERAAQRANHFFPQRLAFDFGAVVQERDAAGEVVEHEQRFGRRVVQNREATIER